MRAFFLVVALMFIALSSQAYNGPRNPVIPAENEPIRLQASECLADVKDVVSWGDEEEQKEANKLCALRQKHQASRNRVLAGLAKLVETFDGMTNHDHDQNLPKTIEAVQTNVASCLAALGSQEYPHNIAVVTEPENDAIFCDDVGTKIIEAIIGPNF